MLRPLRESPAARQGTHSFRVDVALACLLALLTVVLPGLDGAYAWSPEFAFGLGLVLCGALAWRRRRPVGAAAVVLAVCLVELVTLPGELLLANVAVPMTVYALAAYGPPWAGRAGLGAGLVGSVLAAAGYQRAGQIEVFVAAAVGIGVVVVAAWALGVLRRARLEEARPVWGGRRAELPVLERVSEWLRQHPFGVDATIAAFLLLVTVVASSPIAYPGNPEVSAAVGALLIVPLAWRRRRPVRAAAVVVAASLLELAVVREFLPANVAAPLMVYALAAYAPRWASRAGLVTGLVGALLASARYYSNDQVDAFVVSAGAISVLVIASWALGDLRRARLQQVAGLEERARLLELERAQEMQLAASAERARIAREMHDVVAHSLSVVIAQADGGRYAGLSDPTAATSALEQISATGRQALTDMRTLLGVLREG